MNVTDLLLLTGRIVLGAYFLYSGFAHFQNRSMMAGYAASKKVPFPMLSILGTGLLLTAGGLSLMLGLYPLVGIAALVLFFIGVTPLMHAFWTVKDPMQRMGEKINFTKNMALLGALLVISALPQPWPYSLTAGA